MLLHNELSHWPGTPDLQRFFARNDSLGKMFQERLTHNPNDVAYIDFDEYRQQWKPYTWLEIGHYAGRIQHAMVTEGLQQGDRIALMLRNSWQWVAFDIAAQGLGLVTVPIYTNDRPDNIGYILNDAGVRVLLLENREQFDKVNSIQPMPQKLQRIVSVDLLNSVTTGISPISLNSWANISQSHFLSLSLPSHNLATIVYTSGTTGRPKGVMLSHRNIMWNVEAALKHVEVYADDLFLSFLPLSHALERTVGHYLPMAVGARVAHVRSIQTLAEDMQVIKPTIMIAVPRIFERMVSAIEQKLEQGPAVKRWLYKKTVEVGRKAFEHQQSRSGWSPDLLLHPLLDKLVGEKIRDKMGGNLRVVVSGGAPLSSKISRDLIALGIPILQGYGLTETSPIISANRLDDNLPESVGTPLAGVEIKTADNNELLTRSPSVMQGYWNKPKADREVIDKDGWFHTGDVAKIEQGNIFITGRIKEIIVLANGEKIAPADIELCISEDEEIEQALVVGEGKPYLGVLIVPASPKATAKALLKRIKEKMAVFPGYAKIHRLVLIDKPWTVENGLMTPTLKLRRTKIINHHQNAVESLFSGH